MFFSFLNAWKRSIATNIVLKVSFQYIIKYFTKTVIKDDKIDKDCKKYEKASMEHWI